MEIKVIWLGNAECLENLREFKDIYAKYNDLEDKYFSIEEEQSKITEEIEKRIDERKEEIVEMRKTLDIFENANLDDYGTVGKLSILEFKLLEVINKVAQLKEIIVEEEIEKLLLI